MKVFNRILFLIIFVCINFSLLEAKEIKKEPVSLNVNVSTDTITIGDRFVYNVILEYDAGVLIGDFSPIDGLSDFEIKDFEIKDPEKKGFFSNKMQKKMSYILSTFTVGEYKIPELIIPFTDTDGSKKEIKAEEIVINVQSVAKKGAETGDIRDIKSSVKAKYPLWYYAFIIGAPIVLILAGLGYYLYKQNKLPSMFMREEKIVEPPDITAMRDLASLKQSDYIQSGEIKQYYIIISEIVKTYLEKRYNINILDKTTYEVYFTLRDQNIDRKIITIIKEFLEDCDLVKFAKYQPDMKTIENDYDSAFNIIESTKEIIQFEEEEI